MSWSAKVLVLLAYLVPLKDRTNFEVEYHMADTRWGLKPEKNMTFSENDQTRTKFCDRGKDSML